MEKFEEDQTKFAARVAPASSTKNRMTSFFKIEQSAKQP